MARIEEEFADAELGDPRRGARLAKLSAKLMERPEESFPTVLDEAGLEGAYRFFSNPAVTLDAVLAPHVAATWRRASHDAVTLALHDTTTLSFRPFGQRADVPTTTRGTQLFLAHTTLAVRGDKTRQPHGVLALSTHALEGNKVLHDRWVDHVDRVTQHASAHANVVHIMDREADDYTLLAALVRRGQRFVIRSHHDRLLEEGTLHEAMGVAEPLFTRDVDLGARTSAHRSNKQRTAYPERDCRRARLAFAAVRVTLPRPPRSQKSLPRALSVNVVRVWEVNTPAGEKPIEWCLLTSEPIADVSAIERIVNWYRSRWVIEEYFKALKTGCAYEKRQLESFHALRNALAVFAAIAWRLLLLRNEARERPDAAAITVLSADQLEVLRAVPRARLPDRPTARDAMLAVARLGGHLPRNGDPGWMVLGRGFERLDTLTAGWVLRRASETCDQ
jgi:hypothetical protein